MDVSLTTEECDTCAVRKKKAGGMEAEREGGIKLEETKEKIESKNRGREGKKVDFERLHEMMWRHSVPVRQNPIHPSSHAQNNDRFISLIPYRFLQQGGDDIKVVLKLKFRNSSIT